MTKPTRCELCGRTYLLVGVPVHACPPLTQEEVDDLLGSVPREGRHLRLLCRLLAELIEGRTALRVVSDLRKDFAEIQADLARIIGETPRIAAEAADVAETAEQLQADLDHEDRQVEKL